MSGIEQVSTGVDSLDNILNFLWPGDNVVWYTPSVDEYRALVQPYVEEAVRNGNTVHYVRFAEHPPVIAEGTEGLSLITLMQVKVSKIFQNRFMNLFTAQARSRILFSIACPHFYHTGQLIVWWQIFLK